MTRQATFDFILKNNVTFRHVYLVFSLYKYEDRSYTYREYGEIKILVLEWIN